MTKTFFPVESLERVQSTTQHRLHERVSERERVKALKTIVKKWTFYKSFCFTLKSISFTAYRRFDYNNWNWGVNYRSIYKFSFFYNENTQLDRYFERWFSRRFDSRKCVMSECGMSWMLQFREPFNQSRVIGALPHCREPRFFLEADNVGRAK